MAEKAKLPWGLEKDTIAQGSAKAISMNKLKAFNIGTMNVKKNLSKKEQEDLKKKQDEAEAAKVYQDFVDTFENTNKGSLNRSWVKGGLVNPDKEKKSSGGSGPRLYKPTSRLADTVLKRKEDEDSPREKPPAPSKKKKEEKKKSNLELFKEELKIIQEEREERHKFKRVHGIDDPSKPKSRFENLEPGGRFAALPADQADYKSFNYDDATTTNLYLGNINPKMSEQQLCELFGKYGPLASVKIMYPRSEEERSRGRNCGFVAFMNRKDGERALANLQGRDIQQYEMKLGWGKQVPIPPRPVYIPPAMLEMTMPPPPSGLPFNAQTKIKGKDRFGNDMENGSQDVNINDPEEFEKTLANAVVKVVIPTDRNLICVIHRVIEFVIREGPMFEAMIMNREINNAMFRFLFENQSPAHIYYRWKLFSLLQGDSPYKWRTAEFCMFKGGSVWRPPPMNPFTSGMPEELINADGDRRGTLPEDQRDKLEDILRDLMPERQRIGDAMVWCLDHAESAEEIVECIQESLSIPETPLPKKIARLFLISDLLYNCSAKVPNASFFRKYFEGKLPEIFQDVKICHDKIDARIKAEQFKAKVQQCFRAWEDWAVYPNDYLIKLQNVFLGLSTKKDDKDQDEELDGAPIDDLDGAPISGDLDGMPMQRKDEHSNGESDQELEGVPMDMGDPDLDGMPMDKSNEAPAMKFKPSKWETVDKEALEAQAMTTSKWDLLEHDEQKRRRGSHPHDIDGAPLEEDIDGDEMSDDSDRGAARDNFKPEMTEERRAKLREIEVKVMKYQDELEGGKRTRKPGMSIFEQVQYYRRKLLQKEEEKAREKERERRRDEDQKKVREWERAQERARERERGSTRDKRRQDSPDSDDYVEVTRDRLGMAKYGRDDSDSSSEATPRGSRHTSSRRSESPPSYRGSNDSPARWRQRSRSRSPRKQQRSRSPKRKSDRKRSRTRSRSRSPSRHKKNKQKKSRR